VRITSDTALAASMFVNLTSFFLAFSLLSTTFTVDACLWRCA
jgi:hypothetical protein